MGVAGTARVTSATVMMLLGTATSAYAAGFALREDSAAQMGTAFAGAGSAADDLSTIFFNPAGMTRLSSGNQAQMVGTAIKPTINFDGKGSGLLGPIGGSDGNDAGRWVFVPAFFGFIDATPDLKFGLAVTAPFGLKTQYENGWVGRYLAQNSTVDSIDINPNVAYKLTQQWSIGGGVSLQRFHGDLDQRINDTVVCAAFGAPCAGDGFARFSGDSWGFGFNLGVLYEPQLGTRLGLSYRSRIEQRLSGTADFTVPSAILPAFRPGAAHAAITTPDNVLFSVTQVITPQFTLMSDLQWTNWSTVQGLTISNDATGLGVSSSPTTSFNFKNTIFASVGGVYKLTEKWALRGGVGFDQTPVRNEFRTVRLPDEDRYIASVGFTWNVTDAVRVDASYLHFFLPDASITGSANASSATGDTLTGNFKLHADEVGVSVRFRF
jgi:long-chain fatty acid transport protein